MAHKLLEPGSYKHLKHSLIEDIQGLFFSICMIGAGIGLLRHLGFITGQIAGMALLFETWTGLSFGSLFLLLNLPFYVLAYYRMSRSFLIKTLLISVGISVVSWLQPLLLNFGEVNPLAGSIVAGLMLGIGMLGVFRHGGSAGGMSILAVYLQDEYQFKAGWALMIFDVVLFLMAFSTLSFGVVVYSLIGAVSLNLMIGLHHRKDRYIAQS